MRFIQPSAAALLLAWILPAAAVLADPPSGWPTARGNNGRTSANLAGPLPGTLQPAWSIETGTPAPAWSGEARGSLWQRIDQPLVPRAADDLAPLPVITGDSILVATTLDEVRCVDRLTGRTRWSHPCAAPVRYAPALAADLVLVGSDDGSIRALDLASGQLRWSTLLGPDQPWIVGNGRLLSPHPVRTGLLVSGGTLFATAGLFPLEGTYLLALDVTDGHLLWRRNLGNVSPQGYLVEAGNDLIVPNGRATPRLHSRTDGSFRRELGNATGTLAVASDNETFTGPGATGAFAAAPAQPGARIISYPGRHLAVTPATSFLVNDRDLLALDRARLRSSRGDLQQSLRWKQSVPSAGALAVAGNHVFVGLSNQVQSFDADSGQPGPSFPVRGNVAGLALTETTLLVTTIDGRITAFLTDRPATQASAPSTQPSTPPAEPETLPPGLARALPLALDQLASDHGFALHADGVPSDARIRALLESNRLHWVFAVPAPDALPLRKRLLAAGWLGRRASVAVQSPDGTLHVADHLFNLVLSSGNTLPTSEARRLATPAPSGVLLIDGQVQAAPAAHDGQWTHQYANAGNSAATTQTLRGFPRLQWFGGHGPERVPDRHTRGHAPLAAAGLIITVAEDGLIATDARNGTVRWNLQLPDSMRYAMPYDAGYAVLEPDASSFRIAVNDAVWKVDARSGGVQSRLGNPAPRAPGDHWGWLARINGRTFGSATHATASRTRKERDLVDLDYRSGRPLVCSHTLFSIDESSGKPIWTSPASGVWVNPTLCATSNHVFGVEARGPKARADRTGRLTCSNLLEQAFVVCLDASTGSRVWEKPLIWPQAEDILGLAAAGDHLVLSCARSAGPQAAYHLRCWKNTDGSELWSASGLNPIHDLYHGQQVKRPVVLADRISFESDLFVRTNGTRWIPPGADPEWILKRPGHACGGMTGCDDGLLFRADNPTYFRFSDGSFTRLSPTRPGCWLNILPVEGGVVIPEASASCICGYPIQASLGFAFRDTPPVLLPDTSRKAAPR